MSQKNNFVCSSCGDRNTLQKGKTLICATCGAKVNRIDSIILGGC